MKAIELMQGNIVLYEYEGQKIPARVIEIYRDSVLVESVSGEYEPIEINEAKIYPIEITTEILEKNGFKHCEAIGAPEQWVIVDDDYELRLFRICGFDELLFAYDDYTTDKPLPRTEIPVLYFHELQRALKSCIAKSSYDYNNGHNQINKDIEL